MAGTDPKLDNLPSGYPDALCDYCRTRRADALERLSTTRWWFICFDCLEAVIERENALAMHPSLVYKMPPLPAPDWRGRPRRDA